MKKIIIIMLSISILGLFGCSKTIKIENGDLVTISYTGTLQNGEVFENGSKTIKIGSGNIIKGIEKSILGKKIGQKIKTSISPEDGYGNQYSTYNQQRISAFVFDKLGISTETGTIVTLDKITGKILKHEQDETGNTIIILDINPAQTRQDVGYEIIIENIEKNGITYNL